MLVSFKCNECGEAKFKLGLLGNDVDAMDDMEKSQGLKVNCLDVANSEEVVSGSPKGDLVVGNGLLASNNLSYRIKAVKANIGNCSDVALASLNVEEDGHRVQKGEKMGSCASLSASSRTKTRMAQLSGNGYSKEMAKIYQKGVPYMDEEVRKCISSSGGNNLDVPPGFSPLLGAKCGGVSIK